MDSGWPVAVPVPVHRNMDVGSLLIAALRLQALPVDVPACSVEVPNRSGACQVSPKEAVELEFIDVDTKMHVEAQILEVKSRGFVQS